MNNNYPSEISDTLQNPTKEIICAWNVEELLFIMEETLYNKFSDQFDLLYLNEMEENNITE